MRRFECKAIWDGINSILTFYIWKQYRMKNIYHLLYDPIMCMWILQKKSETRNFPENWKKPNWNSNIFMLHKYEIKLHSVKIVQILRVLLNSKWGFWSRFNQIHKKCIQWYISYAKRETEVHNTRLKCQKSSCEFWE